MSDQDLQDFVTWLATHTALSRVARGELIAAFRRAEAEAGYVISKQAAQSGVGATNG